MSNLTPPTATSGDTVYAIAKGVLSSTPVVGGLAAELLGRYIASPLARRSLHWMEAVAQGLGELQEEYEGFNMAHLENNEPFLSACLRATQAAMRTHESEKLDALRNAILNVAVKAIAEDEESMFIDYVDRLTTWHIRILRLLQDPLSIASREQYWTGPNTSDALANIVWKIHPDLRVRSDLFRQIINDLRGHGLIAVTATDLNEKRVGQVFGIHLS